MLRKIPMLTHLPVLMSRRNIPPSHSLTCNLTTLNTSSYTISADPLLLFLFSLEDINHNKYSRQNQPLALSLAVIPFPAPSQVSSKASQELAQVNRKRRRGDRKGSLH
jgi:hypothetical protein